MATTPPPTTANAATVKRPRTVAATAAAPSPLVQMDHGDRDDAAAVAADASAASLARAFDETETAVRDAKTWITAAIAAADRLGVGHGHGPIHHLHRFD